MFKKILLTMLAVFSLCSEAALQQVTTKVNYVRNYTLSDAKALDIQVKFDAPCPTGSDGFYLEKAGDYETALSILLSALAADKEVHVHYETEMRPNFSSATDFCRIYSLGIKK